MEPFVTQHVFSAHPKFFGIRAGCKGDPVAQLRGQKVTTSPRSTCRLRGLITGDPPAPPCCPLPTLARSPPQPPASCPQPVGCCCIRPSRSRRVSGERGVRDGDPGGLRQPCRWDSCCRDEAPAFPSALTCETSGEACERDWQLSDLLDWNRLLWQNLAW